MAHFAELDENNVVLRVVVVGDKDTADANGVEKEHIGAAFCERLFGGTWKQTSYNGNMRARFAGIGMTYDADNDVFLSPKPYASWTLNTDTWAWDAPIARPADEDPEADPPIVYEWDEDAYQADNTTGWTLVSND